MLTKFNNKNGWNTSMCYSSTLMINHSTSIPYPTKKWNTPVTLFPKNQSTFLRNNSKFNFLLTNPFQHHMFFCLPFTRRALRHWPSSLSTYVEIYTPVRITITSINNKNRCPTSIGTGTLHRQSTLLHPLNTFKTVPPLGHFQPKNSHISPLINLNVVNLCLDFY